MGPVNSPGTGYFRGDKFPDTTRPTRSLKRLNRDIYATTPSVQFCRKICLDNFRVSTWLLKWEGVEHVAFGVGKYSVTTRNSICNPTSFMQ